MYDFHPPLSAFPLVLFTIAFVSEIYLLSKKNQFIKQLVCFCIYFGSLFTLLTFLSGYMAGAEASKTFDVDYSFISKHHSIGKLCLFLEIPLLVLLQLRSMNKVALYLYYLNLLVVYALILYTGYLGADLIFNHGAGVKALSS